MAPAWTARLSSSCKDQGLFTMIVASIRYLPTDHPGTRVQGFVPRPLCPRLRLHPEVRRQVRVLRALQAEHGRRKGQLDAIYQVLVVEET